MDYWAVFAEIIQILLGVKWQRNRDTTGAENQLLQAAQFTEKARKNLDVSDLYLGKTNDEINEFTAKLRKIANA